MKPNTIVSYVREIKRGFFTNWGCNVQLNVSPIFNHPENGLKTVLDNKCRDIQEKHTC